MSILGQSGISPSPSTDKTTAAEDSPFDGDAEEAAAANRSASKSNLDSLIDAWPQIEGIIESSGRLEKLESEVSGYVDLLTQDEKSNRRSRSIIPILMAVFVTIGWYVIYTLITRDWIFFLLIGSNSRVALIAGWSVITGLFITVLLKGVFRVASERHLNGLPENVRAIIEAMQN